MAETATVPDPLLVIDKLFAYEGRNSVIIVTAQPIACCSTGLFTHLSRYVLMEQDR